MQPQPGDVYVEKSTPSSFYETSLQAELTKRDITKLVLCGIQSEICVDTTTRHAFCLGYDVTLARDAHSTYPSDQLAPQQIVKHHNDVLRWFADVVNAGKIEFGA